MNKQQYKKYIGKCYFCAENNIKLLDCHRILEGADGGKYTRRNTIVCCALCHRKVTVGLIKTHRKYLMSNGLWILHWTDEQGIDHYE